MDGSPRIGVVGGGVVGLSVALSLQSSARGAQVSVLADRFEEKTTSHVAAGVFRPGTSFCGPDDDTTK